MVPSVRSARTWTVVPSSTEATKSEMHRAGGSLQSQLELMEGRDMPRSPNELVALSLCKEAGLNRSWKNLHASG